MQQVSVLQTAGQQQINEPESKLSWSNWAHFSGQRFIIKNIPYDTEQRILNVLGFFPWLQNKRFIIEYLEGSIHDGQFDSKSMIIRFSYLTPSKRLIAHELTHLWSYLVKDVPRSHEKLTDIFSMSISSNLIDTPPSYLATNIIPRFQYYELDIFRYYYSDKLHEICKLIRSKWRRGIGYKLVNEAEHLIYDYTQELRTLYPAFESLYSKTWSENQKVNKPLSES